MLELFTVVGRFDTANDVTLSELRRSGPMTTPNAASSSIDLRSGLGRGSVEVVGVVALSRLSTCVV